MSWANLDDAFVNVAKGIRQVVHERRTTEIIEQEDVQTLSITGQNIPKPPKTKSHLHSDISFPSQLDKKTIENFINSLSRKLNATLTFLPGVNNILRFKINLQSVRILDPEKPLFIVPIWSLNQDPKAAFNILKKEPRDSICLFFCFTEEKYLSISEIKLPQSWCVISPPALKAL